MILRKQKPNQANKDESNQKKKKVKKISKFIPTKTGRGRESLCQKHQSREGERERDLQGNNIDETKNIQKYNLILSLNSPRQLLLQFVHELVALRVISDL